MAFGHFDDDDDDDDSNFNPENSNEPNDVDKKKSKKKPTERKKPKVMHPCDQCSSRYSSLGQVILNNNIAKYLATCAQIL